MKRSKLSSTKTNGQRTHRSLVLCIYIKNLDEQVRKKTNGCLVSMGGLDTAQFFHQVGVWGCQCIHIYKYANICDVNQ